MSELTGYIPNNAYMSLSDYTTSPSGVYYGTISAAGDFWIVPGTNPTNSPCCLGAMTAFSGFGSSKDLGGFFGHMQTDGNFVIYTSATGKDVGTIIPLGASNSNPPSPSPPYFAQVSDSGSFTIYQGSGPSNQGSAIFTASGFNSPVKSIVISGVAYDTSHASVHSSPITVHTPYVNTNDTSSPLQGNDLASFSWTRSASYSFNTSSTVGTNITGSAGINIFGFSLGGSVTAVDSTTISHGQATTTSSTQTDTIGARPTVPAFSQYTTYVTATTGTFTIPYTWEGVATYENGNTANVSGTGTYAGADTGDFVTTTVCDFQPGGCPAIPLVTYGAFRGELPEPATVALMAVMLLGLTAVRRFRAVHLGE